MHEVLVNRLGGLSLSRKSVDRLSDRPDMTLDVYRGRKTTIPQQQLQSSVFLAFKPFQEFVSLEENHRLHFGSRAPSREASRKSQRAFHFVKMLRRNIEVSPYFNIFKGSCCFDVFN